MIDLNYYCRVYDNFLEPDVCEFYIDNFEKLMRDEKEKIDSLSICDKAIRSDGSKYCGSCNCQRLDPMQHDCFLEKNNYVMNKIPELVKKYKNDVNLHSVQWPKTYAFEALRIKRFLVGSGNLDPSIDQQFSEHVDVTSHAAAKRFLIIMVYLNENFKGGETVFPIFGDSVKPKIGRAFVFPPNWMYLHAGRPPLAPGYAKYFLMTYLNYDDIVNVKYPKDFL